MSLRGDLSTLDLPGLFQNVEGARQSGLLTLEAERETRLYFREGRIALVAYAGRPALLDYLVATEDVRPSDADDARRRARGRTTPLAWLLREGEIERERVVEVATARLVDDVCELVAAGAGRFELAQGDVPEGLFDPDEIALELGLAASPLLLEAARRADHWRLVRERVPSDSIHYVLARTPRETGDPGADDLLRSVASLCDGTRSVGEVVERFPDRRFQAYELLAGLAHKGVVRPAGPAEVGRLVHELARSDAGRARVLVERGLATAPRDLKLLATQAMLAEQAGETERAVEALKTLAHVHLETGRPDAARAELDRLQRLAPDDPFAFEKAFDLALAEEREEEARQLGARLIELHRAPGLVRKVQAVVEHLIAAFGADFELVRELAHARAEAGHLDEAVRGLEEYGARLLAREAYLPARLAYEEALALDPRCERARSTLEAIQSGEIARRRERWRRFRRRAIATIAAALFLPALGYELLARHALARATREIVEEGLLEDRRHEEAAARLRAVAGRWKYSTVALFEARQVAAAIEARRSSRP